MLGPLVIPVHMLQEFFLFSLLESMLNTVLGFQSLSAVKIELR